jgi:hypothetical protein
VIRPVAAAVLALLLMQLTSCAGGTVGVSAGYPPDGYWDGPVYGYDLDYFYGPPVLYGGWGPDYYVGPPRWAGHPRGWGGPAPGTRPGFRPAPPGRPMPSIPTGPRGGGVRGAPMRP